MARIKKPEIIVSEDVIARGRLLNVIAPDTTGRYDNVNVEVNKSYKDKGFKCAQVKCLGTDGKGEKKIYNIRLINEFNQCKGKYKHLWLEDLREFITPTILKAIDELDWQYS